MRVLLIPHPLGGVSHLIPLVRLYTRLGRGTKSAFFLSAATKEHQGEYLREVFGVEILKTSHNYTISSELAAYSEFNPDVVIDDTNLVTAYARQIRPVPRVTVLRTGIFPNIFPRNQAHTHSMGHTVDQMPNVGDYGFERHSDFRDFFQAEARIVPGIRSIELVDDTLHRDPLCGFSGPLLLDDVDILPRAPLEAFLARNRGRRRVYLTYGGTQGRDAPKEVVECIRGMLERDIAVVSNVDVGRASLLGRFPETYYSVPYLPMNYVCSNVDFVFHHCGSGAYHYPILHGVFSVTLGTQKYDREDVALRLEELGVSKHIPGPSENESFVETFNACVERYLFERHYDIERSQRMFGQLKTEIRDTESSFDLMALLALAAQTRPDSTGRAPTRSQASSPPPAPKGFSRAD